MTPDITTENRDMIAAIYARQRGGAPRRRHDEERSTFARTRAALPSLHHQVGLNLSHHGVARLNDVDGFALSVSSVEHADDLVSDDLLPELRSILAGVDVPLLALRGEVHLLTFDRRALELNLAPSHTASI